MTVKHRYLSGLNDSSCTYLIRLGSARAENGFNREGSVLGYETAAGKRLDQRKWLAGPGNAQRGGLRRISRNCPSCCKRPKDGAESEKKGVGRLDRQDRRDAFQGPKSSQKTALGSVWEDCNSRSKSHVRTARMARAGKYGRAPMGNARVFSAGKLYNSRRNSASKAKWLAATIKEQRNLLAAGAFVAAILRFSTQVEFLKLVPAHKGA
jgi:hypothetical protein